MPSWTLELRPSCKKGLADMRNLGSEITSRWEASLFTRRSPAVPEDPFRKGEEKSISVPHGVSGAPSSESTTENESFTRKVIKGILTKKALERGHSLQMFLNLNTTRPGSREKARGGRGPRVRRRISSKPLLSKTRPGRAHPREANDGSGQHTGRN